MNKYYNTIHLCKYLIISNLLKNLCDKFLYVYVSLNYEEFPYCLLFYGEDIMIEEPVKLLVGVVDTQLLKTVGLKKNKNIWSYKEITLQYSD